MGAPIGNEFWKLAKNIGRPKIFSSPEELWDKACEYFQWCIENQILTVEFHGKDATQCIVPKMRAFTWEGLEIFLGIESLRWYKTSESHKEFLQVIGVIEKIIWEQKFTGAAAGVLNANIIAKDLGLVDKKEIDASVKMESAVIDWSNGQ